jgi:hypothetical protein
MEPLPAVKEPVQTALALLAIVPPWGIAQILHILELPAKVHRQNRCRKKRNTTLHLVDAPARLQDAQN